MKTNNEINTTVDPGLEDGPSNILNSKCNFLRIETKNKENFLGISQKTGRQKVKIKIDLNQFSERFKFAAGSKTENKFVIMFKKRFFLFLLLSEVF